jgi:hypothetical protein
VSALTLGLVTAGVVALLLATARTRSVREGLSWALDFWLVAALLQLGGEPAWPQVGTAAAIVVLRQLVRMRPRALRRGRHG